MNVLAIGSDRSVCTRASASARRQVAYGARIGSLDIIVFSLRERVCAPIRLSAETRVHPTESRAKLWYGVDAMRLAHSMPRPDVVTAQDPFESGLVAWAIARIYGAKLHMQVHTDPFASNFGDSIRNRARRIIARFTLRRADHIRTVSTRVKTGIEAAVALVCPITVLPIYTDVARFASARPGNLTERFHLFSRKFLVVSRLEREKNITLAIKSFAQVAPQDTCLIIVGDGSERKILEAQVKELAISGRVFFEGVQDPASYYALADLLLVTSHYEGYGNVIIEALAAGKPVLATDVGIAREAGALIAAPEEYPAALQSWINDGLRSAVLQNYPYRDFETYVEAYYADIVGNYSAAAVSRSPSSSETAGV